MPTFKYEARYPSGEVAEGVIEAVNRNDAVAQLRRNFEMVVDLREVPKSIVSTAGKRLTTSNKIGMKALALACKQFSIILQAGLPLVQTVELAADQTSDKMLAQTLRQVATDVSAGWSLSRSFDERAPQLPVTFRETIRAGEESGDLVAAFQRMATYYDRMQKTRAKTITTLSYPGMIILVAIIVISIVMGYAVPVFTQIFESMNAQLPPITQFLIGMSNFFRDWILVIFAVLALLIFGVFMYSRTAAGGIQVSKIRLRLPLIGEIGRMGGASQFAHTMSSMLAAGMPLLQAIEVSGRTMDNRVMSQEVLDALPGVEDGRTLGDSLALTANEIPEMLVQMTTVGEATGSIEDTLDVVASYYDNEVDTRTERALALLEPIIICCLALFVVFILLAVYLPMFSMYQNI